MTEVIDKTSKKYQIALKFVNLILKNINKPEITDLIDFKYIDRVDIIKDENKAALIELENEIFAKDCFDKKKSRFFYRNSVKNYILTFMRYVCNDLDLDLKYVKKNVTVNCLVKAHLYYTISNK